MRCEEEIFTYISTGETLSRELKNGSVLELSVDIYDNISGWKAVLGIFPYNIKRLRLHAAVLQSYNEIRLKNAE